MRKFQTRFPAIIESVEVGTIPAVGSRDRNKGRIAVTALADVQAAVDDLAASLAHPVLVEDARHRPLWWSAQGEVDATRMRSIMQREVSPAAAVVARLGLAHADGPVRTPAVPEAEMLPRWCVPLRSGGRLLGYLWVLNGDGLVTEARLPQIVACADLAALALTQSRTQEDRHRQRTALLARLEAGPDAAAARDLIALEQLDPAVTVVVQASRTSGGRRLRRRPSARRVGEGPRWPSPDPLRWPAGDPRRSIAAGLS